jgi:hypothetical protein
MREDVSHGLAPNFIDYQVSLSGKHLLLTEADIDVNGKQTGTIVFLHEYSR